LLDEESQKYFLWILILLLVVLPILIMAKICYLVTMRISI
jgi:hypothetical protein